MAAGGSPSDPKFRGFSYGVRHTSVEKTTSLLEHVENVLASEAERPSLSALELIELGSIYVNDERALNPARALPPQARVRIHTRPRRYPQPPDLKGRIVSEDASVLVVDKPAGLPVHALVDNINENLISYLEDLRGGVLYITHRLDVETSGLVLLAKTPEEQARLNRAFAEGTVKRTYAAYAEQRVATGTHVHFMEPSPKAPKTVSPEAQPGWLRCELTVLSCEEQLGETAAISEGRTTWELASGVSRVFRIEIALQTGRPQQVRAQLAALRAPIIGDVNYGSSVSVVDQDTRRAAVALRAISVSAAALEKTVSPT